MMKRKPVKLTAMQEDEVKQKLQQLSQQDEIQLPESLRSSNLLAKLQDQPSFVRIDTDPAPRRRSVYVITTCAAALLLVVGLARIMPGLGAVNNFSMAQQAGMSSSMAMAASNEGGISDYQEIITALQYLTNASNESELSREQRNFPSVASVGNAPESSADSAAPAEGASIKGSMGVNPDTAGGVADDTSPAVSSSTAAVSSQDMVQQPLQAPRGEMKKDSSMVTKNTASGETAGIPESAPAFEEEDDNEASPYVLEEAPYISYSDPVSATGEWAYWLDVQNNTLQQLNSKTMEQSAKALIPSSAAVAYMESYGDLVACIDPYQLSYYDESSLVSAENPGITVYLYQTQTGEETSLQLVNTVSMSGSYETSYLSSSGLLYLVSNQKVHADEETIEDVLRGGGSEEPELNSRLSNVLPIVYNKNLDEAPSLMPPAQISLIGTPVDLNYLNVMVIDLANGGACSFWGFLGRKGSLAICDNTISMVASDGEGGSQLVSIDFSNDRVSYRLSLTIAPLEEFQTEIASSAPSSENTYYPPQTKNPGT